MNFLYYSANTSVAWQLAWTERLWFHFHKETTPLPSPLESNVQGLYLNKQYKLFTLTMYFKISTLNKLSVVQSSSRICQKYFNLHFFFLIDNLDSRKESWKPVVAEVTYFLPIFIVLSFFREPLYQLHDHPE